MPLNIQEGPEIDGGSYSFSQPVNQQSQSGGDVAQNEDTHDKASRYESMKAGKERMDTAQKNANHRRGNTVMQVNG